MQTLLIAMTIVAVIAALLPNNIVAMFFFYFVLDFAPLIVFVVGAVYARGRWQTFFIGAACAAWLTRGAGSAYSMLSAVQFLGNSLWVIFQFALGGALAILVRWFIERRGWNLSPASDKKNLAD